MLNSSAQVFCTSSADRQSDIGVCLMAKRKIIADHSGSEMQTLWAHSKPVCCSLSLGRLMMQLRPRALRLLGRSALFYLYIILGTLLLVVH